jgi:hypothetical protein
VRVLATSVVLSAFTLSCAISAPTRPLAEALPAAIPAAAERAQWERIDGEFTSGTDHVRYALLVDPTRPLLFRVTQYRVTGRPGGHMSAPEESPETVIWNELPGERVPLRCFAEERRRDWRRLGLKVRSSWRDVTPGTLEFRLMMGRALQIYARVAAEGRGGPPVR